MDRRDFLTGAAALASSFAAARALAAEPEPAAATAAGSTKRDPRLTKLVDTATECVRTGDACVRHCMNLLATGDTSLAGCMERVLETNAVCEALAKLGALASAPGPQLVAFAAACATYCRDCAAECKKHENHHEICRTCMEACDRCAEACEALRA